MKGESPNFIRGCDMGGGLRPKADKEPKAEEWAWPTRVFVDLVDMARFEAVAEFAELGVLSRVVVCPAGKDSRLAYLLELTKTQQTELGRLSWVELEPVEQLHRLIYGSMLVQPFGIADGAEGLYYLSKPKTVEPAKLPKL